MISFRMSGSSGPVIPLDESSKGADSPWIIVILLLLFLGLLVLFYLT